MGTCVKGDFTVTAACPGPDTKVCADGSTVTRKVSAHWAKGHCESAPGVRIEDKHSNIYHTSQKECLRNCVNPSFTACERSVSGDSCLSHKVPVTGSSQTDDAFCWMPATCEFPACADSSSGSGDGTSGDGTSRDGTSGDVTGDGSGAGDGKNVSAAGFLAPY